LEPIKFIGLDDGAFIPKISRKCLLLGVLLKGLRLSSISMRTIEVDGMDVTEKTLSIIEELGGADLLITGGITFAGFNVLDPFSIHQRTRIPVVIFSRKKPDNEAVLRALKKHFTDWKVRWNIIERVGEAFEVVEWKTGLRYYIECVGIEPSRAVELLSPTILWGKTPEPLRLARLLSKALSRLSVYQ